MMLAEYHSDITQKKAKSKTSATKFPKKKKELVAELNICIS